MEETRQRSSDKKVESQQLSTNVAHNRRVAHGSRRLFSNNLRIVMRAQQKTTTIGVPAATKSEEGAATRSPALDVEHRTIVQNFAKQSIGDTHTTYSANLSVSGAPHVDLNRPGTGPRPCLVQNVKQSPTARRLA